MLYGTRHGKSKLSTRLTRVYAVLFSAIFLLLSAGVFLLAFRFLIQKQWDHLVNTMELIGDNLMEEVEEGDLLENHEILEEFNVDPNLSIFIYNNDGTLTNRVLNFPLPNNMPMKSGRSPELFLYRDTLMLRASRPIAEDGISFGRLNLVYSLSSETSFLRLLGMLLLGANVAGAGIALLVSRRTSRRMLAPIGQMITAANQIGQSTMDERLKVPEADDELRSLANTINSMLDRVFAAYRQQGRFVADVSHELRTPLAVMQGNIDLLSRWGTQDRAVLHDSIRALEKQTSYMNDLVENLLLLARYDNAQARLHPAEFHVGTLFDELVEEQALIDPAHVYRSEVSSDVLITADRAMIRQLLRALLDNSVKYTPEGGAIRLSCTRADESVVFTVSDDGCGMDQEACQHIFERFYRVDEARTRATGGMGLGLSIVLAIAQAHGGTAQAQSEPGKGTRVTITIPQP